MMLTGQMRKAAAKDFLHPNEYELKKYVIKDGKKHPFALIVPGGGYGTVCSFVEGQPFAEKLNQIGISSFVLYYHVKKKALYPNPQQDVARALKEILDGQEAEYLIKENYSIWGSSAGGHLVASFGTTSMGYHNYNLPKPGALILIYPVITMTELTHKGSRNNHLGKNPTLSEIERSSVEKQIDEHYPATFIWCGEDDHTVNPQNSRLLANALNEKGIVHRLIIYPGIDHGVGLGTGTVCENWFNEAVQFWQEQCK